MEAFSAIIVAAIIVAVNGLDFADNEKLYKAIPNLKDVHKKFCAQKHEESVMTKLEECTKTVVETLHQLDPDHDVEKFMEECFKIADAKKDVEHLLTNNTEFDKIVMTCSPHFHTCKEEHFKKLEEKKAGMSEEDKAQFKDFYDALKKDIQIAVDCVEGVFDEEEKKKEEEKKEEEKKEE